MTFYFEHKIKSKHKVRCQNRLFWCIFAVNIKNCLPFLREHVDTSGKPFRVLRGDPATDVVHDVIKFFEELPGLPIGNRSIHVVVGRSLCWGVGRIREDLPAFVLNRFNDPTLNMTVTWLMLNSSASILVVKLWSSSTASRRAWSSKSDGRPLAFLSSRLLSPSQADEPLKTLSSTDGPITIGLVEITKSVGGRFVLVEVK